MAAKISEFVKSSNDSTGVTPLQPSYPSTSTDPSAGSEYNAATTSSLVFGIFMALLALYGMWQYNRQYSVFIGYLLQHYRSNSTSPENENVDVDVEIDIEIGTLNSMGSSE